MTKPAATPHNAAVMPEVNSVVIVGASLGGIRTASALRRGGYAGRITLIGAEKHLPYDRPPLSKQILLGKWQPERTLLSTQEEIDKLELDLRLGVRAVGLDTGRMAVSLDTGGAVPYEALVIATGASPITLRDVQPLAGLHVLRTMEDALAIRAAMEGGARVAVIGGGFIGAEVAAAARQRGLSTTILEALSQPLERALGARVGAAAAAIHRSHGAIVRCGVTVAGVEGDGRVERVILADGSSVPADLVVVGIGVRPETGWLDGAGLEIDNGVVCDEYLRASAPGVYAIGDVCRWTNPLYGESMRVEHWTNAVEQAMTVAKNIMAQPGQEKPYAAVPYVWSDQYDVSIQYVGHARGDDDFAVKHGSLEEGRFVGLYGRAGRLMAAVAFNMHRELGDYRRLIAGKASMEQAIAHVIEEDDD